MPMNSYLSELAKGLIPYVPGEQPMDRQYIKLNTNENPYGPSESVLTAIAEEVSNLRLYPDPDCKSLRQALSAYYKVESNQLFVGNGSDEVLALAFPAFFSGGTVLFPDITYSFYPVYAKLFNTDYIEIPLKADFSVDAEDYTSNAIEKIMNANINNTSIDSADRSISSVESSSRSADSSTKSIVRGILLPNPNAPTGRYLGLEEIEKIVAANRDKVVIIDEAYIDFGGESAVGLLSSYENLLAVMTLSKSRSLAGLRLGFAIGSPALIQGLETVKNSFNSYTVDRLAMKGAISAMEDEPYFQDTRHKIMATRERVSEVLTQLDFEVVPSSANFIFIQHQTKKASYLFDMLRKQGVLVRYFDKPRIGNYLRVSIGTDADMDVFLKAIGGLV
jgi:histidinol-phosphate aminotransferase